MCAGCVQPVAPSLKKVIGMNPLFDRLAPGHTAKLNLLLDLCFLFAALQLASALEPLGTLEPGWSWLGAVVTWVTIAGLFGHYQPHALSGTTTHDASRLSLLVMAVAWWVTAATFVEGSWRVGPVGSLLVSLWGASLLARIIFRRLARMDGPRDEVLIVGTGQLARDTAAKLSRQQRHVLGYVAFDKKSLGSNTPVPGAPVLGWVGELEQILREHPVDEVYIAGRPTHEGSAAQFAVSTCEELGIPFALPKLNVKLSRARLADADQSQDDYLHLLNIDPKPQQIALKRMFDIVASAGALLVLSPLLFIVALIIKLTDRGPIFFAQPRVGLHGRPFKMYKFRSMVVNAEALKAKLEKLNEQTGPVFKMQNDPRITRIGRFIRKFSIDELPQLLNVLKGDMSVVGPRPALASEVAKYQRWQLRRLSVRPGLTCIWQVSGRNQITFEQWMKMDMQYIDQWSLWGDFSLIAKTVPVVLTGRGAS